MRKKILLLLACGITLPCIAKNSLNLYAGYGAMMSSPIVANQTTGSGSGTAIGAFFDFISSKEVSWEIGLLTSNRKFTLNGVEKNWNYLQISPLVRYYAVPGIFSLGASVHYAQRTTEDSEFKNQEIGAALSARAEFDILPSKVFGVGLFVEGRAVAGLLGLGTGSSIIHLDFQGFGGLRFGFV